MMFLSASMIVCLCFVCPMEVQALTIEMSLVKQFGCPENWSDFGSFVFEAILAYTRLTMDLLMFVTCSLAVRQREATVAYYQKLVLLDPWLAPHRVGRHDGPELVSGSARFYSCVSR